MFIPIIISVRGVIFASIIVLSLGIFVTISNSKEKLEYEKASGTIEYYDKEFQNLPTRNKGDFRYLKIDSYPYLFEIYEPNSEPIEKSIDDLMIGDKVDIYYYENSDTRDVGINRFAQFIDKEGEPFFVRNGFQKQLGYVVIGLSVLLNIMAFVLWKKGKLKW